MASEAHWVISPADGTAAASVVVEAVSASVAACSGTTVLTFDMSGFPEECFFAPIDAVVAEDNEAEHVRSNACDPGLFEPSFFGE